MSLTLKNDAMSTFTRLNSKTWIKAKSKESLNEYRIKLDSESIKGVTAKSVEKRPIALIKNKKKAYLTFVRNAFKDDKFLSERQFNRLLIQRYGNSTWYRKRLIELGLITSKNKLIKPVLNEVFENTTNT